MYTLDRFGEGALPFDLVLPGRGRGTLHLRDDGAILVDLDRPLTLPADPAGPVTTLDDLAGRIEDALGPDVALVGKAITLLPMLAAEFTLAFHEGASGYSDRTRLLVERLAALGMSLPALRPILRIRYHCWDALQAAPDGTVFRLPPHLAGAFGRETLSASEFAACWQCAVQRATQRLAELKETRSPRALLAYLRRVTGDPDHWDERDREHEAARLRLLALWDRAQAIQGRVYTLYDQVRVLKREITDLEQQKGDDFRRRVKPLRERLYELSAAGPLLRTAAKRAPSNSRSRSFKRSAAFPLTSRSSSATARSALRSPRCATSRPGALPWSAVRKRRRRAPPSPASSRSRGRPGAPGGDALRARDGLPHTNFRPSPGGSPSWTLPAPGSAA
jgi:hypothetical protein